jgi:hypothetical protein
MDIITKTARDAARLLNAIRAQYIIVLPTGEQIIQGDLKLHVPDAKPDKRAKRASRHPHGFLNQHILPYLQHLKVGDVAVIPVPNGADMDEIQGSGASISAKLWGNGSYKTMRNANTGNLEVLRMA